MLAAHKGDPSELVDSEQHMLQVVGGLGSGDLGLATSALTAHFALFVCPLYCKGCAGVASKVPCLTLVLHACGHAMRR